MARRSTRWSESDAQAALDRADQAASDHAYARQKKLSPQRITWWRQRLGRPRNGPGKRERRAESMGFVEIVGGNNVGGSSVEVRLRNGRELRVDVSVDPEAVAKLASALEE